jgi:hypothetical protein
LVIELLKLNKDNLETVKLLLSLLEDIENKSIKIEELLNILVVSSIFLEEGIIEKLKVIALKENISNEETKLIIERVTKNLKQNDELRNKEEKVISILENILIS